MSMATVGRLLPVAAKVHYKASPAALLKFSVTPCPLCVLPWHRCHSREIAYTVLSLYGRGLHAYAEEYLAFCNLSGVVWDSLPDSPWRPRWQWRKGLSVFFLSASLFSYNSLVTVTWLFGCGRSSGYSAYDGTIRHCNTALSGAPCWISRPTSPARHGSLTRWRDRGNNDECELYSRRRPACFCPVSYSTH